MLFFTRWLDHAAAFDKDKGADDADDKLSKAVSRLITKKGGETEAITMLLKENGGYRDKIRDLKSQVSDLEAKVPEDGAVVLTGDDLKAYTTLKEQGSLEDITKKLIEATEAQSELAGYKKKERLAEVAKSAGVNLEALTLVGSDKEYVVKKEGQEEKVFVKDGDKEVALSDYADKNWAGVKDSLFSDGSLSEQSTRRVLNQRPGGKPPRGKVTVDDIVQRKRESGKYAL